MSGSLDFLNHKERTAIERFSETVKSRLGESVVRISVFGSKVRGDYKATSDIDVLVIVKDRSLRVMDQIAEITSDLNIEYDLSIAPVVFSEPEFDMNAQMASLRDLQRQADMVWKSTNGFISYLKRSLAEPAN